MKKYLFLSVLCIGGIFVLTYERLSQAQRTITPEQRGKRLLEKRHEKDPSETQEEIKLAMELYKNDKKAFWRFLDQRFGEGGTYLMHLAFFGDTEQILFFLNALKEYYGNDLESILKYLNLKNNQGRTAFWLVTFNRQHHAAFAFLDTVAQILGSNKELFFEFISAQDNLGITPLIQAAFYGSSKMIKAMTEKALKIFGENSDSFNKFLNQENKAGYRALDDVISQNDLLFLQKYGAEKSKKAQLKQLEEEDLGKELLEAVKTQDLSKGKKILQEAKIKHKGNPVGFRDFMQTRDEEGWNALLNSAADGQLEFVEVLFDALNDYYKDESPDTLFMILNTVDINGKTMLHLALVRKHFEVAQRIIERITELVEKNPSLKYYFAQFMNTPEELNGLTQLGIAAYNSSDEELFFETIQKLIESYLKIFKKNTREWDLFINAIDASGIRPLSYAKNVTLIKELLEDYGAHE